MHPALETFVFKRGARAVRNRTVLAAMTNKQSHPDGTLSENEIQWLEARSEGGFGIVTTAATNVEEDGQGWEGEFGTWSEGHLDGLTEMAKAIKNHGGIALTQLFHGGMRAPERLTGLQPKSASANDLGRGLGKSRAMEEKEIEETIRAFGRAANLCERAKFDGVELHGAHGYLIAQFLGSSTNRRKDTWGGNQTNRTRFLAEIVREVRRSTGPDFLVGVRLSPVLNSCGLGLADALETLELCNAMELDFVHVSCWDITETGVANNREQPYTSHFREVLDDDIPLMTTGGVWNAQEAELAFEQGADFVGVARAGIAHPDWPSYLAAGQAEPQRPPFDEAMLTEAKLSPVFIQYMRRWDGFVSD